MTLATKTSLPLQTLAAFAMLAVVSGNPTQVYESTAAASTDTGLAGAQSDSQTLHWQQAAATKARAERVAKIRALRGMYAHLPISSDDYIRLKHAERD